MTASKTDYPFDNVLDPDFVRDPYPAVAIARQTAPVHHVADVNMWLVTRYDDIKSILKDPASFLNSTTNSPLFPFSGKVGELLQNRGFCPSAPVTSSDGALHKRMRMNVAKALAFTPKNLQAMKVWIDEEAEQNVLELPRDEPFNIVKLLTSQYPARVIYRFIGFPREMNDQLLAWSSDRMRLYWGRSEEHEQIALAEAMADYWDYCVRFVEENLASPQDNMTGNLIRMHQEQPDRLSLNEVTTVVFGLVFAGQETTANSTAQMLYLLLKDRLLWEKVLADPRLIDAAFEETLRIAPPVAAWRRSTVSDVEVRGHKILADNQLLLHFGSAGHDSAKFDDPDEFRLDRTNGTEHFAFGHGAHFCLGAPLARLEARSLLEALQRHMPALRLMDDQAVQLIPNLSFRGPKSIIVTAS